MDSLTRRLRIFLIVMSSIMIVSAIGLMIVENLSFVDSIYFTVVTVASVGYGDIHPITLPGKLLATVLILGGVGAFGGVFATLTEFLLSRKDSEIRLKKRNLVTSIFFSQIGDWLIHDLSLNNPRIEELKKVVWIQADWSPKDFEALRYCLWVTSFFVVLSRRSVSGRGFHSGGNADARYRPFSNGSWLVSTMAGGALYV